jgi:hypothetical protein
VNNGGRWAEDKPEGGGEKLTALCHAYAHADNENDAARLMSLIEDAAGGV